MPEPAQLLTKISSDSEEENVDNLPVAEESTGSLLTKVSAENNGAAGDSANEAPRPGSLLSPISAESEPAAGSLLKPIESGAPSSGSLLQAVRVEPSQPESKQLLAPVEVDSKPKQLLAPVEVNNTPETAGQAVEQEPVKPVANEGPATATVGVQSQENAVSALQYSNYLSFIAAFVLSGFAAVMLFRKAASFSAERLMSAAHLFAIGCGVLMLHGFVNTYLYSTYLQGSRDTLPLTFSFAAWVVIAPLAAIILGKALTLKAVPGGSKYFTINAALAGVGGASATVAVFSGLPHNAALGAAIAGFVLATIAGIRAYLNYLETKPDLKAGSLQTLVLSLSIVPVLAIGSALLGVLGVSGEIVQLLLNLLVAVIAASVALSLIGLEKFESTAEQPSRDVETVEEFKTRETKAPFGSSRPPMKAPPAPAPAREIPKPPAQTPARVGGGSAAAAPTADSNAPAPNAPTQIKAPAKPKKRF